MVVPAGAALHPKAGLLSQQLGIERLQHGAALATLQRRIEALEAQLMKRDDAVRRVCPTPCQICACFDAVP
jgi:hypothetical protein